MDSCPSTALIKAASASSLTKISGKLPAIDHFNKARHDSLEVTCDCPVKATALTELWRTYPDAAAAARLLDFIEEVDDIETDFDGCFCCDLDPARQVNVECLVRTEL